MIDYDVLVPQNDHTIEYYFHEETLAGMGEYEVLFPEGSEGPAEVSATINSIRTDEQIQKLHETVTFSVNVVPEFGVLVMMILVVSFIPILLISKSKIKI